MFDSSVLAIQVSNLINDEDERRSVESHALRLAEIIENYGVEQFFDEADGLYLCQTIIALVEALNIRCCKEKIYAKK